MKRMMMYLTVLVLTLLVLFTMPATAQTWSQLATVGSPPATGVSGGGYDVANNRLIAFFPAQTGAQVWVLENANGLGGVATWTQLTPAGLSPTNNGESTVVYDSVTNQLIVYGGCLANCGAPLADVFVLSNANGLGGAPAWSQSSTNPAEAREAQSAVYNLSNQRMIVFGGGLAFFGTDQNDTRILAPANATNSAWNTMTPAGPLPGIREGHSATYNQTQNLMTIFGGNDAISACCPYNIAQYNDVWVLSSADGSGASTPTWTQLAPTGDLPAPRTNHSAVYDSAANTMYIFGGLQWSNLTQSYTPLGDVWKLTNADGHGTATPNWKQIGQLGTPPGANYSQVAVFDHANRRMIVFGGADRNFQSHNLTFILDFLQH
ncbi:MAG TPA: kelch repeat-containing protein [Candidatus Angelobacter sp.]